MHFRLVDSDLVSPERSAAIDEAILLARDRGSVPDTLHLYRRDRPTVSLGYFERTSTCLDKGAMERLGVKTVRRASGGSAIYTDPGQLIYSVIMDRRSVPEDPQTTFRMLCQGLVLGLEELGVRADYRPVNDILVDGRKISGSAQMRRGCAVLQHGTLLVSVDYDRMFAVLRSSKRVRASMVSLSELIEPVPSMDAVKKAVVRGFSRALGCSIERGTLTSSEVKDVDELVATKYGRDEHTYLR
ncbi:MAG: Lipoate-protein ligase A subunit 1 [Methanomassiliicoccales archaeon PtaU1.Bin030]|nr:MAG: Lipoate-protein ligase A subunit 1 [Methanomassiliicoccales archaeon PtaU1.Bin030]